MAEDPREPRTEEPREPRSSIELALGQGPKDHPSEVILALARTARSFITYDARNDLVRRLIAAYRDTTAAALAKHGPLAFDVHPFELLWRGEVIYSEQDRERSLAFRLFRDGVRQLTIKPDVPWEELLKLLEILSIRYTGIRQHEDDTLTLLRQAGFLSIEFVVVEAYVPSEEDPEGVTGRLQLTKQVQAPKDWDLPLPRFTSSVQVQYREIPPEQLAAIRAEDEGDGQIAAATQVVTEVLTLATRAADDAITEKALGLVEEVCKFFIVDLRPKELVWTLRETRAKLGDTPGVQALQETFAKAEILERFLRDPEDIAVDALLPLFALVPGDNLDRVIDRFVSEESPQTRRALKTILARLALGKPDALLARFGKVPAERVVDLFNVVCVVAPPERAIEAAYSLAEHASPEVQLGALEVLAAAPITSKFHLVLAQLLACDTPRVRVKAANVYAPRGGSRAFTALLQLLERLCATALEPVEAAALGRGMMLASKATALPLLRGWIRPSGIGGVVQRLKWGKLSHRMRRWAAVAGLAEDPTEKNRELIAWLKEHGDDELRQHCEETLARLGAGNG